MRKINLSVKAQEAYFYNCVYYDLPYCFADGGFFLINSFHAQGNRKTIFQMQQKGAEMRYANEKN